MKKPIADNCWTTEDELAFINYIASDERRGSNKKRPSLEGRKFKLQAWLGTANKRSWPSYIDVFKCREHALQLKAGM